MNNKTTSKKITEQKWHFIDADGKTLGRISTDIAKILIGKNKSDFSPNQISGDKVVITNVSKIVFTGKKLSDKKYYWHTGFPRGLRETNLEKLLNKKPTEALRKSVYGMLPKNKLQKERMNNLYLYVGTEHPHKGQENK